MRRERRLIIAASVVALLVVTAVRADAFGGRRFQGPPAHDGPGFLRGIETILDLRLTPEQQDRIQAVLKKHRQEMDDARKVHREARRNLRAVMDDPKSDEAAVRKAFKAVAAAEEELAVLRHTVRREVEGILTPEQREKIRNKLFKHREGIAPPFPGPAGDDAPPKG
ncbi:Heavy-metal resistance [Desulfacinum infernum DSM 9756]|uniref:Heavy-metal resistance n=1 Tax=Desulfacinum infernum DSM 9756 TaxID=1121391 RepID=A0A1M4YI74_9BACT|nr:Spy/CpxP family protein refolding chaperone [Desulfacinum infernum]SHF05232.1 Heavy-metal resistance [Desulfacinum infernum DSM 9756]